MARYSRSRGLALRPIDSTKNVVDTSSVLAAGVNTIISAPIIAVENPLLANVTDVERGCKINGFYLSLFFYTESGGGAAQVPLVDWYVLKDEGTAFSTIGFAAGGLPTPGTTGVHVNKYAIFHEEKGLAGQQAAGSPPMVFQGVIVIPRGKRSFSMADRIVIAARANFDTKYCMKVIYKWYK